MKETDTEQELTAEKVARSRKSVRGPGQFKNGGEIVLNTEQCRELNRVRARERRWNNTNNAVTQASENFRKNWNARKNWLRRLQNFARRDMMCSCARRVAWFHQQVTNTANKRNHTCFACIEDLQEGEHSEKKSLIRWSIKKICSVQSSQLLLEVLAIGFTLKWTAKLW